jgi:DNA mismatch repair protein MutS2
MDNRTFALLGFDRVRNILAQKTQTDLGKELALQIAPMQNISEIDYEFDLVSEALDLSEEISLSSLIDLRPYLTGISDNTVLQPSVLRDALTTLQIIRKAKEFLSKKKNTAPKLFQLTQDMLTYEPIEKAIDKAIDEFGEVKSDASPKLRKVRSEITHKRNEIIKRLEDIVVEQSEILQDANFSVRHDRFCIPLKVEAQKKIPGILHEYSPARKTVFIEPLELVDNQNELARCRDEEKNEIHRILSNLSKELYKIHDEILSAFSIIAKLDTLFAKKRFAIQFNCTRPNLTPDGKIRIIKGVHPLLKLSKQEIVPLDIEFPTDTNIILISGPNAGGKTVVLKTVGLFAIMSLAGLFLPVSQGTELPFFQKVFADIGDEQSLDSNLSSFSAHILRVKEIIENADNKSLILLDEIGSSTAPDEGSALAIAVLENLRDKGAYCLATSHFNPLKAFVNDAAGMINASMEFTNHPTYRFSIGLPGTSSAFEISKGLGFPEIVLQRARNFLNQDWLKLSERLKILASEIERTLVLNEKIDKEKANLERIRNDYDSKVKKFKLFEQEERKKILNEGQRFLIEQRRNIENLVRNIKESNAEKKSIIEAKNYVEAQLNSIDIKDSQPVTTQTTIPKDIYHTGDIVYSKTFQKNGIILESNKNTVIIGFGSIKFELNYDDLEKISKDSDHSTNITTSTTQTDYQPEYFEPILSIRGQTKEEAWTSINKFLDDAVSNNIPEVSIIHGKGKGILKDLIWETLNHDARIAQLRFGESFEGGMGLTKIILKKKE